MPESPSRSRHSLTALPKRPSDQVLLAKLAASHFEPDREYREAEVNEELSNRLETFCEPYGIDHVTMRRLMVDSRLLMGDTAGASYHVGDVERLDAEPAQVLAEIARERKDRKDKHAD